MTFPNAVLVLVLTSLAVHAAQLSASAQTRQGPAPIYSPLSTPPATATPASLPDPAVRAALLRLDALEEQNRSLTGRIERLEFELAGAKRDAQEKDQRIDILSKQIATLEKAAGTAQGALSSDLEDTGLENRGLAASTLQNAGPTFEAGSGPDTGSSRDMTTTDVRPATPGVLGSIPAENLPGEAGPMFREAKNRLLRGDYPGAERAFETFIVQYPDDPSAPDAQFWLGETLFVQQAYPQAAQSYITLLRDWPDSLQAPNALVKLAASLREMGETPRACAALDQLKRTYPNTPASILQRADAERARSSCR